MNTGHLFIIVGPSGVGKGTLISALKSQHKAKWVFPISATTRPPRPQEKNGETYYFLSKKVFERKIKNHEFLEYAIVHGKEYYGLLKDPVLKSLEKGDTIIREVDIQGFESIRKHIDPQHLSSIFLLPPNLQTLEKRILSRAAMSKEQLQRRIESAKREIELSKETDFQCISEEGKIEELVQKVETFILSKIR